MDRVLQAQIGMLLHAPTTKPRNDRLPRAPVRWKRVFVA